MRRSQSSGTTKLRAPVWAIIYVALVLVFLFAPLLVVVFISFNSSPAVQLPLAGVSLRWYRQIAGDPLVIAAFGRTAIAAAVTAVVSGFLGLTAALAAVRLSKRLRTVIFMVPMFPLAFPALLYAIGLATLYHEVGIGFSLWATIGGHVVLAFPFAFLVLGAALERFHFTLLEAAHDLGAGSLTTFRTVTLPLLLPALLGAMFLAMAISVDEFVIAFFTAGSQQTLPLLLYGRINLGVTPSLNAIGTVLLAVSMTLAFLAARLTTFERQ
jgi:spermidine/putrescine transport system permease protein